MGSIGYFLCKLKRSIAQFPRVKLYTDRSLRHLLILSIDRLFPEIVQRIIRSIGYLLCKFKRSIGNSHRYNKSVNTTIDRLFPLQIEMIDRTIRKSETLYRSMAKAFANFIDRSLIPRICTENNTIDRLFALQI
jgi:hypothetical protein